MAIQTREGMVDWLGLPKPDRHFEHDGYHKTFEVKKIKVDIGVGILGDGHASLRLADTRETLIKRFGLPTGFKTANHREYSAISKEELAVISTAMETKDGIPFGLLGENIVISGIPEFTLLPSGTFLFFESSKGKKRFAILAVWDINEPCHIPAAAIQDLMSPEKPAERFQLAAKNRRGITGSVFSSGKIETGDKVFAMWDDRKI